jgi:murein DD-endopeptidase MepM/ murein hydrolase activator NlpD
MSQPTRTDNMMYKIAINRYRLPVPKKLLQRIDRSSSPAHLGKLRNAIDFIVGEETPVLAAADGVVTFVDDSSNTGGPNPIYWSYTNFIMIMHSNGEYSRYDLLSYNSSKVKVGQYVRSWSRDSPGRNDWIYISTTSSFSGFRSYWNKCVDGF